ncbi:MAG: hypothetical protein M3R00_10245, partial [Pseudomonadota bacterium]|nr:hypothetical protein [Pseudomonadota bacterium]
MKNKQINPSLVTDKLIELVHAASLQGSLADLSEDQLNAIARPDSILGLVTLLNAVDQSSQEAIIALVDIDYLAMHFIWNAQQLGACLAISPLLTQRLLEHPIIEHRIYDYTPLIEVLRIVPQYAATLLARPILRSIIDRGEVLALIINAAPECAHDLLTDPAMLNICFRCSEGMYSAILDTYFLYEDGMQYAIFLGKVRDVPECANILADYLSSKIKSGGVLTQTLLAAPQLCDIMLNNPKLCALINDEDVLTWIIQKTPQSADILLTRSEMLALITSVGGLARIIAAAPQWSIRVLNDSRLRKLIKTGEDVLCLIEEAPQIAMILLSNLEMRALIQHGSLIERIVSCAPHCVNPSLSIAQIAAFYEINRDNSVVRRTLRVHVLNKLYTAQMFNDIPQQWATFFNVLPGSEQAAAQYNDQVMKEARFLWQFPSIIRGLEWVPIYIKALPQCAEFLLTDSRTLAHLGGYLLLEVIVSAVPRYHDKLLTEIRRCKFDFDNYDLALRAIIVLPQLAEILFECSNILEFDNFPKELLIASPQCAKALFNNGRIHNQILNFDKLYSLISLAPEFAHVLLNQKQLRALIQCGDNLRDIIKVAPDCAGLLLEDLNLQKFISDHALELLQLAPQCAYTIRLCTEHATWSKIDFLAKYADIAPENELEVIEHEFTKEDPFCELRR